MSATFLRSLTSTDDLPETDAPQVAMLGRANVGKSSFINHLTGQKGLANVSASPGRTRTINLYDIDRRYLLVDLPGYGYSKAAKEDREGFRAMIEGYLSSAKRLALVLLVIDARHGPTDLDRDMISFLLDSETPFVMIANKMDKLPRSKTLSILRGYANEFPHVTLIPCSTVADKSTNDIRAEIDKALRDAATKKGLSR